MTVRRRRMSMDDAMHKAEQEKQEREASQSSTHLPFRFSLRKDQETEIILLDETLDYFSYEHSNYDPVTKRSDTYICTKEYENCNCCANLEKPSYFVGYMSIVDLTPYTTKKGVNVEFSRKLLAIKGIYLKNWKRKLDPILEREGTLRGAKFRLYRADEKTSAAIGTDIEFVEMVDLEAANYTRSYTKDGEEVTEDLTTVINYDEMLTTMEEIAVKTFGSTNSVSDTDPEGLDSFTPPSRGRRAGL